MAESDRSHLDRVVVARVEDFISTDDTVRRCVFSKCCPKDP